MIYVDARLFRGQRYLKPLSAQRFYRVMVRPAWRRHRQADLTSLEATGNFHRTLAHRMMDEAVRP